MEVNLYTEVEITAKNMERIIRQVLHNPDVEAINIMDNKTTQYVSDFENQNSFL